MNQHREIWEKWNLSGGPKYPHEKVIQFCFRRYPRREDRELKALDLGCGGGVHSLFLAAEGFSVTGVDVSARAITVSKERLASHGYHGEFLVQSLDSIDLPSGQFDLVVCVGVLEAAGPESSRIGLEALATVLKFGGVGIFLFAANDDFRIHGPNSENLYGYQRDEVQAMFADKFTSVWIDEYITTYEGGQLRQHDWLVTLQK